MTASQKQKLKLTLAIVAILGVVIFFATKKSKETPTEEATSQPIENSNSVPDPLVPGGPVMAGAAVDGPKVGQLEGSVEKLQSAIQQCFSQDDDLTKLSQVTDTASFLEELKSRGVQNEEKEVENYQIELPDHTQKRVQLLYSPEDEASLSVEMRLFSVDSQGLPIPMTVPAMDSSNPSEEVIQRYLSEGQVNFHQVRSQLFFENGIRGEIEMINDKPHDIRLETPGGTLACRDLDCRCL